METSNDPEIRTTVDQVIDKAKSFIPLLSESQAYSISELFMIERMSVGNTKEFHHAIVQKITGRIKWSLLEMDLNRLKRMMEMTNEKLLMRICKL